MDLAPGRHWEREGTGRAKFCGLKVVIEGMLYAEEEEVYITRTFLPLLSPGFWGP